MSYPLISDYALLSDCHSAALVSRDGSVDWCCFHRFDARPVFARILDWERGGFSRVSTRDGSRSKRRYLPGTNVLETRIEADRGVITVSDCLPVRPPGEREPPEGCHPYHQLLRVIRCDEGEVDLVVEFHPRFDYGLTVPRLELSDARTALVYGGADALVLQSSVEMEASGACGCAADTRLRAGEEAFLSVTYARPHELRAAPFDMSQAAARLRATVGFWQEWAARCTYDGPYRDAVERSALVLKALTHAPTGAIVAAPTTSLPESIGGARNWDYRFSWLRDAALDLYALFTLGYRDEAHAFMAWLMRTTAGQAKDLQPLYGVGGERLLPEVELDGVEGYRGSRPVRIGNRAVRQLQLDVYGELVDTAWQYHRHGGRIDHAFWAFIQDVVAVVEQRWEEPDEGIWEVRGGRRHFVSSKVMAWVAVDRAIKLARACGLPAEQERWRRLRDAIRAKVEAEGVDPGTGGFVRSFGSVEPDASNLLIPLVGFLPANDPRVRATFEAVERELAPHGLVHRYRAVDGLPDSEGAFVICSFWLVDNLALAGEIDRATELFDRILALRNDVGLLAEEIDPGSGEALGNFPQAFSHVGLIGAAMNLERAARRTVR